MIGRLKKLRKLKKEIPKGGESGINSHVSNRIRLSYRAHNQIYEPKINAGFKKRKVERKEKKEKEVIKQCLHYVYLR